MTCTQPCFSEKPVTEASIEDIILRHSVRGMDLLRPYLDEHYCLRAARQLLSLPKGCILLTTGFYVAGHAETDGPPGTVALAYTLQKAGFTPVIVTDEICRGLFEAAQLTVEYVSIDATEAVYDAILMRYQPSCLISIERCGHNMHNDYVNMRGVSIAARTAQIDRMFEMAGIRHIFTIGIGDGGNEIGMGNLGQIIYRRLGFEPCTVPVDSLIIATTSNWGAYALSAYLSILTQTTAFPTYQSISAYLEKLVTFGCVDGVTKKTTASVDGFAPEIEKEIIEALHRHITSYA